MSDFYNERLVKKTRKDHRCFGCREKIPTGSTAFYISGVYQGDFGAYYLCKPCREYLDRNPQAASEGYYEGDLRDVRREEANDNANRD